MKSEAWVALETTGCLLRATNRGDQPRGENCITVKTAGRSGKPKSLSSFLASNVSYWVLTLSAGLRLLSSLLVW